MPHARTLLLLALLTAGCASPNPDVPASLEDIAVPPQYERYDDSETKSYYEKHEKFRSARISYRGRTDACDPAAFYQRQMPNDGWKLEDATPGANKGECKLTYVKELERARIWVTPSNNDMTSVTIEIGYNK